jgi:MtN3 and saliva related transmembrane protein
MLTDGALPSVRGRTMAAQGKVVLSHSLSKTPLPGVRMNPTLVNAVGTIGAVLTTACWLPQATKMIRDKDTSGISLSATAAFTVGIGFWLIYGFALVDWPLIVSNTVTLGLMAVILALKLRHG